MIYIKTKLINKKALHQNNHWIYNLELAAYHRHCFSRKESITTNVKAGKNYHLILLLKIRLDVDGKLFLE